MRNSVAALGHLWTADAQCERCGISAPPINYIGASGQATCSDYHIIVGSGDLEVGSSTKNSWYAVYGDVNLTTLKFIDETSNIILKDGAKLTITSTNSNDAIYAKSLNIYSESGGNGTLDVSCNRSAIYALYTLNIYGGNISATAGNAHAITNNGCSRRRLCRSAGDDHAGQLCPQYRRSLLQRRHRQQRCTDASC